MIIEDKLCGAVVVDEPVLVELVETAPVQRLKGVTMGGIVALLGISPRTTRYEHSVGAMLLTRRLGASVDEQAAALLHDVSHTALSHVIDYVFNRASAQDFHDDEKLDYAGRTEIPEICGRHGLDLVAILDETRYPLLEQPAPRLCADRTDYTLRDLEPLGIASAEEARSLLTKITSVGGRMAFIDAESARQFGEGYLACARRSWVNPRHVAFYELCGQALRHAFDRGFLRHEDIWGTDDDLWAKLQDAGRRDGAVAEVMDGLAPDVEFVAAPPDEADLSARAKVRWIDPEVAIDGDVVPLSAISAEYAASIAEYRDANSDVVHLRFSDGTRPVGRSVLRGVRSASG
ncbi:HD domain-containing protein [Sorangium sp. So ce381]|uniref:HD domain-containing protein n=1 Tax=Sorangium sp. So ce381 TaxID=3133307 RepID=UPI003F5C779E